MTRPALLALCTVVAALAGCEGTEGDVLSSLTGDGGVTSDADAAAASDAGALACDQPRACPAPSPGEVTVCGHVVDLADSTVLEGDAVIIRVFDLIELTTNPLNPDPLAAVEPDACGRFEATGIDAPFPGLIVVTTDDSDKIGGTFRRVASLVDANSGQAVLWNAFALRTATDQAWATAAGLAGSSFADQGGIVPIFIDVSEPPTGPFQGTPVAGVVLDQGGLGGGEDYYFTDADPLVRATPDDDATVTGASGSAIWSGGLPTNNYDGDKAGCSFESVNGIGLPGFIQAQEMLGSCK